MTVVKKTTPKINYMLTPKREILRPRTAYNFFYSYQRDLILKAKKHPGESNNDDYVQTTKNESHTICNNKLRRQKRQHRKTHGLIGLQELTRTVAKKWKEASKETRKRFKDLAEKDKCRYQDETRNSKCIMSDTKYIIEPITSSDIIQPTNDCDSLVSKVFQKYNGFGKKLDLIKGVKYSIYIDKLGIKWSDEELNFLRYIAKEC